MPEQQTVWIHIGRGKTGTTALQRHLADNAETLLAYGVHYPAAAGGAQRIGHDTFGKALITTIPSYMIPPKDPDLALQAMAAEVSESVAPQILISTEQLALADPGRVRTFLDGLGRRYEYRILYFVRSQDELAESEYNQLLRVRRVTGSLSEYAQTSFDGNFLMTATAWENAFGNGSVACHVYSARHPRVLEQVLGSLGAERALAAIPAMAPANRSLSFQKLTAARLLQEFAGDDPEALFAQLFRGDIADALPAIYFDSAEAAGFRANFGESNRTLSHRYLGQEREDLGGRRYTDAERDAIRDRIKALRLDRF